MTDDDRKGPPRRAESVVEETRRKIAEQLQKRATDTPGGQRANDAYGFKHPSQSPARDFYSIKTPIPPRQDDGVPSWEAEDIKSGVHAAEPGGALELIRKRAGATLDATRASLAVTQTLDARVGTVETDVRDLKGSVALVQSSLDAQDKYLKPMVDVFAGRVTMDYTRERAHLETGAAQKTSELKALDLQRDRSTAMYKTVLAWVTPIVTAVIAFGAARC